jgi:hypothetical protein
LPARPQQQQRAYRAAAKATARFSSKKVKSVPVIAGEAANWLASGQWIGYLAG